jgi:hypothetical protein
MSKPLKPINKNLESVTLEDIENHKLISEKELIKDLRKLLKFDADSNANKFYGNPFLYHYQFKNLLKCRREDSKKTIYDIHNDPVKWAKLLDDTRFRNRGGRTAAGNIYECFRINLGSIVMFKSTTAKYLYKKYNATHVLDPTMGWGGRMLGAWALDIDYTGIDTNVEMKPAYDGMTEFLRTKAKTFGNGLMEEETKSHLTTIWQSCLDVDFSKIDYDFVLTSPPYINLEMYEHMELWDSDTAFYKKFFIPLWQKCMDHIKPNKFVCFNISPKMYDNALAHGLPACNKEEDLLQQLGQQKKKKKQDKIYIWQS